MSTPSCYISFLLFITFIHLCLSSKNTSNVLCKDVEREALREFKNGLIDHGNKLASWVGLEEECCNWVGIVSDNYTGHVHQIHLLGLDGHCRVDDYTNNKEYNAAATQMLGGHISRSLLNLKQLKHLDLSCNDFGGIEIPSFMGTFVNLRYLNLSSSRFGGIIPHQLGNLSKLEVLSLGSYYDDTYGSESTSLPKLQWLSNLRLLHRLDMSGVDLSKATDWLQDDGSPVSIFSLTGSNANDGHLAAGRNGVKRLRTVRHPNVLSFLHSTEAEIFDGSSTKVVIYIVTEPVMPLAEKIKELGLQGIQRNEYYAWGLYRIAKAVSFLNNDCKLVHGNVCLESVVVTPTLDWKLHAFDALSEFDGNNEVSTGPMLQYEWLIGSQYKPMELAKADWATIRKSPPWAIDSWGLGCLIYEIFAGLKLSKTEELRNTSSIPKSLLPDYQRLLSSMPARRLNSSKLAENCEYFQNKLVDTIHFMEILNLKDSVEKDTFFRKLPTLAEQLPREIVLKKFLPLLASALEFGSATAPALTAFLKMGAWLSPEEFNKKVLPTIVKLFASNDRAIRVGLLQHIDQYGESFSAQVVDEQVYPHIATGFSDTSAFLRELTLKSMLVLAPKLSQRTLSGSLLKYLSKLQVDEEPAIRTNTTILLGNIASHLNEGTRKRVLINAFTVRALRDTFPHARGAGLMALCATSSYYDAQEIAARILPNVVVLTIDPDSDVRSKAFQAVEQFLQIVKQYHEKTYAGDGTEATGSGITSLPGNASILGWAMSSLTTKSKPSEQTAPLPPKSTLPLVTAVSNASSVVSETPSTILVRTASSGADIADQDMYSQPAPVSPTSTDGWGELENGINEDHESEKDGWDDMLPLEDEKPSPALANIQAAQKRPVIQTKPQASIPRPKSTSHVGNADDDLWGSIAAPPPKVGAKPLNANPTTSLDNDDPWAAIAAPPPTTRAKPLSAGRGRGSKPAAPKLGAQRINRASSTQKF